MKHKPTRSPRSRPSGNRPHREGQAGRGPAPERIPTPDLYGHHAVAAAILNPERIIHHILVTDDNADWATDLWQKARGRGIKRPIPARVAKSTLDHACPSGAVHQGVAAIADPLPEASFDDWLRALEPNQGAVVVMLDQVTDPHNFGAILRSACAFGALGVVVQRRHTPDINALIAKTACGGVDLCPVAYETNLARTLDAAGKGGFITLGLDERGEPLPAILATLPATAPRRIMIVLGAEGPGLRRLIREGCDHLVALPTMPELPSLNVSNAAAVALYAVTTGTPAQKPL